MVYHFHLQDSDAESDNFPISALISGSLLVSLLICIIPERVGPGLARYLFEVHSPSFTLSRSSLSSSLPHTTIRSHGTSPFGSKQSPFFHFYSSFKGKDTTPTRSMDSTLDPLHSTGMPLYILIFLLLLHVEY